MNHSMSFNTTQTISSPQQLRTTINSPLQSPNASQPSDKDQECWKICRDRFKNVILAVVLVQYLMLLLYSIIPNIGFLHPLTWFKEFFSILFSPLIIVVVIHGLMTSRPFFKEKIYQPTRFAKFLDGFGQESFILMLNFFIGLFTALLFIRYLGEDLKTFWIKAEEKKFLNEKFAFLILNGPFMRCYFHFESTQKFTFPIVHQSKFLQLRRDIVSTVKTSFRKSLLPLFHYIGFYIVFGGSFCSMLQKIFSLNAESSSILESVTGILNLRLLVASWILSSLIWSSSELTSKIVNIFTTQPMKFAIEEDSLTLSDALSTLKFHITQQLAAQDLFNLADNPSSTRRKRFYALSNPGGHPHNWKKLVQNSLLVVNSFSDDLKKTVDSITKTRSNNNDNLNSGFYQPINQFFESKRIIREFNDFNGVRNLTTSPLKLPQQDGIEKQLDYVEVIKEKILANKFINFFFGELEEAKLNFLLTQNSQTVEWIVQGISAIVTRSIKEDSYGVVQHDIKAILKSLIELKNVLDKVGRVNAIAKDLDFIALKGAVRRSIYRIATEFSKFFDDLLLDAQDLRALNSFITFKEL